MSVLSIFHMPVKGDRVKFSIRLGPLSMPSGETQSGLFRPVEVWGTVVSTAEGLVTVALEDLGGHEVTVPVDDVLKVESKDDGSVCPLCGTDHRDEQSAIVAVGVLGDSCMMKSTPGIACDMWEAGIEVRDVWKHLPGEGLWKWKGHIVDFGGGDVEYKGEFFRISDCDFICEDYGYNWGTSGADL